MADRRTRELLVNARLVTATAASRLAADPVEFLVLVARRSPARLRHRLAQALSRARWPEVVALAPLVADQPGQARSALAGHAPAASAVRRRIGAAVAAALGDHEDGIPEFPVAAARAAWLGGDDEYAVTLLSSDPSRSARSLLTAYRGDLEVLAAGYELEPVGRRASPIAATASVHLLVNSRPHTQSGYSLRSHGLLRALRAAGTDAQAATRLGYPVTIGVPIARHRDVVDGVPYHRLIAARPGPDQPRRLAQTARLLVQLSEQLRPGVLHTTSPYQNGLIVDAVARGTGRPWVYEVRGQPELTWAARAERSHGDPERIARRVALIAAKEIEVARRADRVVTTSETMRADLLARGLAAEQVVVVPNAVERQLLAMGPSREQARAAVGIPDDEVWVGSITSVVDYEGLDTLVRAVRIARDRAVPLRCAIVGDGVVLPHLRSLVAELRLDDVVRLPGRVPPALAQTWHRALDVFVVPRRDLPVCRVVTPLKPVEAMAAGRPLVVSDVPALAELVATGAGLRVTPDDAEALAAALEMLAADPAQRHTCGEAGREFASRRTWEAGAGTILGVYEELAETGVRT